MSIDKNAAELLRRAFPPKLIQRRKVAGGRSQDYVSHAAVTDRLLAADPDYTFGGFEPVVVHGTIVQEQDEFGEKPKARFIADPEGLPHVIAVTGWLEVHGVRRYEVGEVEHFTTYGDEYKKAVSDLLKRCAMRFGVALDLWAKEELAAAGYDDAASERAGEGSEDALRMGKARTTDEPEPAQPTPEGGGGGAPEPTAAPSGPSGSTEKADLSAHPNRPHHMKPAADFPGYVMCTKSPCRYWEYVGKDDA